MAQACSLEESWCVHADVQQCLCLALLLQALSGAEGLEGVQVVSVELGHQLGRDTVDPLVVVFEPTPTLAVFDADGSNTWGGGEGEGAKGRHP